MANTPVLGWERVESFTKGRKRPKAIVVRHSATLRAWEAAAIGAVALGAFLILIPRDRPGPVSDNPWIQLFGGVVSPFFRFTGL